MIALVTYRKLHPKTLAALEQFCPPNGVELETVPVGDDDFAAWAVIERLWGDDDLVLVDHDIEIHESVLPAFGACNRMYCSFPYLISQDHYLDHGTGCLRIRSAAQALVSPSDVQAIYGSCWACGGTKPGCWRHTDGRLLAAMEGKGIPLHVHEPSVTHHKRGICQQVCCR